MKRGRPRRALAYLNMLATVLLLNGLLLAALHDPRPAQADSASSPSLRWGYYVRQQSSLESVRLNVQFLDILSPFYFVLGKSGLIDGSDQSEVTSYAKSKGVKVVPMLQNTVTQNDFHALISNPAIVQNILNQIEYLVLAYDYDGFHIDFEDLNSEDRPYLTQFMAALNARLKPKGKLVTMAVAAKYSEVTTGWAGPYDYAALAPSLDLVTVMTYDFSYSGSRPGPVAPVNWVIAVSNFAASQFGPGKVLLGIPFYGYDWNLSKGGSGSARDYPTIMGLVQQYGGTLSFDENSQAPYAEYTQDGDRHQVWFEDVRSIGVKMDVLRWSTLAGWAAWRMGQEGAEVWPVLTSLANPTRPVAAIPGTPAQIYFKETGHTLGSLFLKYWQNNGGLARFGYPWTEEFEEKNALDGKIYLVQYFERARFEYHPEAGSPVQLGLIGRELATKRRNEPPFQPIAAPAETNDLRYFLESGHTLKGAFKKFWETTGGLTLYGLPISEEFSELSPLDGQLYTVQYFERNRLEYHPESAQTRAEVVPGMLGNQLMLQKGWLTQFAR